MCMNERRMRPIIGLVAVIVVIGAFFWLVSPGRSGSSPAPESADSSLYPAPELSELGNGRGLQFVNGYANW